MSFDAANLDEKFRFNTHFFAQIFYLPPFSTKGLKHNQMGIMPMCD